MLGFRLVLRSFGEFSNECPVAIDDLISHRTYAFFDFKRVLARCQAVVFHLGNEIAFHVDGIKLLGD